MAHHHHHLNQFEHSTSTSDSSPSNNITVQLHRPLAPHRAKRGGGGRFNGRGWYSSLPKRAINYDLAESFVDHSTNPLSSDLYQIKLKHSIKRWPQGRFKTYRETLNRQDGNIIQITCTRTFPTVAKRKMMPESEPMISSMLFIDPKTQEQKKKLADQQTNFYNNFLGGMRIPKLPLATTQVKKDISITPSTSISLLAENKEDHLYECK